MMNLTQTGCLLLSLLMPLDATTQPAETEWPKRELRYQAGPAGHREGNTPRDARYTAVLTLSPRRETYPWPDSLDLLKTAAGKTMSNEQRAMIERRPQDVAHTVPYNPDSELWVWKLDAVSEDDARKMAEAFLERWDTSARRELEAMKKQVEKIRAFIPDAERKIADLQVAVDAAKKEIGDIEKLVVYRGPDEARHELLDIDRALRSVQVEMVGIKAKAEAIKNWRNRGYSDWAGKMLAAEDVELAGVLARKAALEGYRKTAEQYGTRYSRMRADQATLDSLKDELSKSRSSLPMWEHSLADPPAKARRPSLRNNTVLICPFEGTLRSPQSPGSPRSQPAR